MSKYFNKVLKAVSLLSVEIIKPVDPEFSTTREITINSRYILHFKVTYKIISDWIYFSFQFHYIIHLVIHLQLMFFYILFLELCKSNRWNTYVSQENQISFIRWKGVPTQNIMTACSFDMQFTFVWAEWECNAHDTRIFHETIYNPNIKFPKLP
jgi:hypothetical protein